MRDPVYGHEFRQARRSRQLTQVALAKALGVSQSYIAQIEAGRNYPAPALVSRIAEVLGLGPPSENKVAAGLAEMADRFTQNRGVP